MEKSWSDISKKIKVLKSTGPGNPLISGITQNSGQAGPGSLFVAVRGTRTDGHRFISQATAQGARAVVCEEWPADFLPGTSCFLVENSAAALGMLASAWYGHPSEKIKLLGVTGTNGKTTIATLLYDLFTELGFSAGLVSTVEYRVAGERLPASHTTPDALSLNALLDRMAGAGAEFAFMEVSSHAVVQKRISGLGFAGGIFTNITRDHLDYHPTFDDYLKAKKAFFDQLGRESFALINADETHGKIMVQNTGASIRSYAMKNMADYQARVVESGIHGMMLRMDGQEVWTPLIGDFNASNLLAVYAAARELGGKKEEVMKALSRLLPVRGRFETLRQGNGAMAIVDYAHTPDALENVLHTLERLRQENSRIITVIGAGGDRDRGKRPMMARIAAVHSDQVILTSDNPRTEDPLKILDDMESGLEEAGRKKTIRITDRKEAIRAAMTIAGPGDIVLVAGKGHETYQEIQGIRYPFDDREIILEMMKQ